MSKPKAFPTDHVLSVVTGRLICDGIGPVYEVLNWMTGENLFTHQLPRVGTEATALMIKTMPELKHAVDEAEAVNGDNWQEWRDRWVARYGETIDVPKFTAADHERIDPMSEIAEMIPPDQVLVVKV